MLISQEQFKELVAQALDQIPEKFKARLNNLAIFVEDYPSAEQLKKAGLSSSRRLLGLFEGFAQSRRLNFGPVLPDRITIFRVAIMNDCANLQQAKKKITATVKHEIAHHFGSDEAGASKAG